MPNTVVEMHAAIAEALFSGDHMQMQALRRHCLSWMMGDEEAKALRSLFDALAEVTE